MGRTQPTRRPTGARLSRRELDGVIRSIVPAELLDEVPPPGTKMYWATSATGEESIVVVVPKRLIELVSRCTAAERDVLRSAAAGQTDLEIARRRETSVRTVP